MSDRWSAPEKQPEPKRSKAASRCTHDGRCQFTLGKRRCPQPGNICDSPHGPGPWYCRYHIANQQKDALAAEALDEMERDRRTSAPRDWRHDMVDARIAELDLVRKPDETRSAFIARCYQAMPKRLLEKLGLRLKAEGEAA